MERKEIDTSVKKEIDAWISEQQLLSNKTYEITKCARSFFSEVVENIQTDPSPRWKTGNATDSNQQTAITNISNALTTVSQQAPKKAGTIRISTWEVWHQMGKILDQLCFIDKDPQ